MLTIYLWSRGMIDRWDSVKQLSRHSLTFCSGIPRLLDRPQLIDL